MTNQGRELRLRTGARAAWGAGLSNDNPLGGPSSIRAQAPLPAHP
jgi:hypothetical protein